jgi:hypothetical protein
MQSTRGCGPCDPGDEPPPPKGLPLLDLAPGGGCLAVDITAHAGGLLHHLFTLTFSCSSPESIGFGSGWEGAVYFCGPIRQVAPSRELPGALLYGVRTFLDGKKPPRSSGQPGEFHHTIILILIIAGRQLEQWSPPYTDPPH